MLRSRRPLNGEYNDRSMFSWPGLVVLDLKMPEFNGFDFLAWRNARATQKKLIFSQICYFGNALCYPFT
jgi:hypothetical protein